MQAPHASQWRFRTLQLWGTEKKNKFPWPVVHFELWWNALGSQKFCIVCLVVCLDMTYYPQWQAFMEIMFPWFPNQLTSIIHLLVLKRKWVLIQILTEEVHIKSKSLILLCCYWKGGNGSLLHLLFQIGTIELSNFIWKQYLELKLNKLQKFCGNSSEKCFWEWSVKGRENQMVVGLSGGLTLVTYQVPTKSFYYFPPQQDTEKKNKNSWVNMKAF